MELFNYYTLDEVIDKKLVLSELKKLKKEGKIDFELDGDEFKIEDIDLDENELEDLISVFEENDVFPYLEKDDDFGDFGDDFDEYGNEDEY